MGVPKFYRWVSERYPLINTVITEDTHPDIDNLYLDMNGIIHNCVRARDGPLRSSAFDDTAPVAISEEEHILRVFKYIDKLLGLIRPKQMVFLAIDGVAPRAKMNQQRSRRFRSAKDQEEALAAYVGRGEEIPENLFDTNAITPGTEFMFKLTKYLHYFVRRKLKDDPTWQGLQIILSGAETPGEGEHKIMEYIRWKKSLPDYPPNLRHCLYGLDADLIMLALVTHEPHFWILREKISFSHGSASKHNFAAQKFDLASGKNEFQLLSISLLREYLAEDLQFDDITCELDVADEDDDEGGENYFNLHEF